MVKAEIPIISFEPFLTGNAESRNQVATRIYEAFRDVGFLYLKDSGISQERIDEIFALSKEFFDLPLEFKKRYALRDPTENQGYSSKGEDVQSEAIGGGIKKEYNEAYEHRRFKNELCPTPEEITPFKPEIADFKAIMDKFYGECFSLCQEVLRCLAISLALPGGETYFDSIINKGDPQLRIMHYVPVEASLIVESAGKAGPSTGKDSRIQPHCDYGFCTLLFQDSVGGLEIDPFHTGEFIPATPIPGTVLINIGDLLHRLLNGRVKSTMHRVVAPAVRRTPGDILPSRYSIPFFVHPDPTAVIEPILESEDDKKLYKTVNAGDWRSWRTARIYAMSDKEKFFLDKLGIANEVVPPFTPTGVLAHA